MSEKKEQSISRRFLGNSGWMMGQQIYNMLLQLVVGSLSARYLGPENFGLINYGASIISLFSIVSRLGLDSVIINEMIKTPEKRGTYLGSALVMRLLTSIASLLFILGFVMVLEPGNQALWVITLLQSLAVVIQTYEVYTYWFQLNLRMKYVSLATMLAQTVVGAWRILLLATRASVYFFALSASIQHFVCGAVVMWCFRREKNGLQLRFDRTDGTMLLCKSYHFIISGIAVTFYTQIDRVMIGRFISLEAVGLYAAAATIAALWEFVPNALINSARPLIIEAKKQDEKKYLQMFQQLLLFITLLSVVVSVGLTVLGRLAIAILYGSAYYGATLSLGILVWATGFAMIGTARNIWIVAEGYNRYAKYYTLLGAVVNFALNLLFIPRWGITGASVTTLLSQITVAFVAPLLFKGSRSFDGIYLGCFTQLPALWAMAKKLLTHKN